MHKIIFQSDTVVAFCNEKLTPYYSNKSELMYNMNAKTDLIRSNDENVEKHHD